MPVQMQVVENDKMEVKRVLMGMVILYEDKKEVLPVIQTTTGLEYEITSKIKKLVEINKPMVGIAQFEGQTSQFSNIQNLLNQRYTVQPVNLNEEVPPGLTAVLNVSDFDYKVATSTHENGSSAINQNGTTTSLTIKAAF